MSTARHLRAVPPPAPAEGIGAPTLLEECRDTEVGRAYGIEHAEYTSARSIRIKLGRGR